MTKYQQYFERMISLNKELFDNFKILHDQYAFNSDGLQEKFNLEGEKVLIVIRDWENKLCLQSEKGGYGHYTSSLAEKFWGEVRKQFPAIDNVGLKINSGKSTGDLPFSIKKINF